MQIGVVGAGAMGSALAARWIAAGHEVFVGGRSRTRAEAAAKALGCHGGSLREAADYSEVCLLAVRSEGLAITLEAAGASEGSFDGTTIIDCGNAIHLGDFSQVRWDGRSLAEQVQYAAVGSSVVKAFNLCHSEVWARSPQTFGGRPLSVPMCGTDDAKLIASELITAVGCSPVDIGDLSQARHLEAMAGIVIKMLSSGAPTDTVFNLLRADESDHAHDRIRSAE